MVVITDVSRSIEPIMFKCHSLPVNIRTFNGFITHNFLYSDFLPYENAEHATDMRVCERFFFTKSGVVGPECIEI